MFWLQKNPLPVQTEREVYALQHGQRIFRCLYERNSEKTPELFDLKKKWKNYHYNKY